MNNENDHIPGRPKSTENLGGKDLLELYFKDPSLGLIEQALNPDAKTERGLPRIRLSGFVGSSASLFSAAVFSKIPVVHLVILADKESAVYFCNDLENLLGESEFSFHKKQVLLFPTSYRRPYEVEKTDNSNVLMRTEVLKRLSTRSTKTLIVTYPEALSEKVVTRKYLEKATMKLKRGETVDLDFMYDLLDQYGFDRVDFVAEPGQVALRGGIIDVFSYTNDYPYRIEFAGDLVDSIRSFDPANQLSIDKLDHITIVPNVQDRQLQEKRESFPEFLPQGTIIWLYDTAFTLDRLDLEYAKAQKAFEALTGEMAHLEPDELFIGKDAFQKVLTGFPIIEFGKHSMFQATLELEYHTSPQPSFNKNFDLLLANLMDNASRGIKNRILADSPKQVERIYTILDDLVKNRDNQEDLDVAVIHLSLHEGFVDNDRKIACYTDHQIFERYHKFHLAESFSGKQALTLKELYDLKPGDYVTHIDRGVGRYDGLEKINNNGRWQEAIRIIYSHDDLLYVSIHSLHRISKYSGKEGYTPSLDRLGSNAWNKLKAKTKARVKDIAKDLIKLYAQRRSAEGFAFTPDTYLQHELEASFIYEDTPDQVKSTVDVKRDMEALHPMDRLICGDVGFGKTEIAVRAAFKAVTDSKQVALLVPTTILAVQHYKTFRDRLKEFPCRVDYINRFKSPQEQKATLKDLEAGKIDILIGTHRLLSADIKFKDLGLMIVDEEQKFGVAAKEKLKQIKVNVDTLTLTATPIPRTLQFSLMGARDLSIINTPPPNRYPVQTELHAFNEEIIRDAVMYELSRGGQVFFVNNRIQNIIEIAGLVQRIVPDARIAIGHGQMDGHKLEKVMLGFIEGDFDVLVSTTIVESGLDIPNANTIIINDAHHYGLSDLHQLRGRVGRSNRKAFCYLLAPPMSVLTDEARKRLKAIEEFSEIGSGFNIAMRDLDIRGAGNILGAEQSGFITEIGFEMYQKILDEAIHELKISDFSDLYPAEQQKDFVRECQIETDLEILIPDDYIANITERLSLYKELDNTENEDALLAFQDRIIDRFGPVPAETQELFNAIRLRRLAKELGMEKLVLKNGIMTGYFVSNQESPYYQSDVFTAVLRYVQANPRDCKMKETHQKLALIFSSVLNVSSGLDRLRKI
ncbi:MAG: transcription-repair coupling factor [Bacteroidales bacterium]|nr:transcription-repair coupling factor [Bacteroidales bacterium]